jgi:hypothetical protein
MLQTTGSTSNLKVAFTVPIRETNTHKIVCELNRISNYIPNLNAKFNVKESKCQLLLMLQTRDSTSDVKVALLAPIPRTQECGVPCVPKSYEKREQLRLICPTWKKVMRTAV